MMKGSESRDASSDLQYVAYKKKKKENNSSVAVYALGFARCRGVIKELPFHEKMRRLCVNGVTHCSAKAAE